MATTRTTEFAPSDRYIYDAVLCTYAKGWAQVDTRQDASYYGTWANPTTLETFSYCEGDTTHVKCDTDEEFVAHLRELVAWHWDAGYWLGIDPGFGEEVKARFEQLGLGDLLH